MCAVASCEFLEPEPVGRQVFLPEYIDHRSRPMPVRWMSGLKAGPHELLFEVGAGQIGVWTTEVEARFRHSVQLAHVDGQRGRVDVHFEAVGDLPAFRLMRVVAHLDRPGSWVVLLQGWIAQHGLSVHYVPRGDTGRRIIEDPTSGWVFLRTVGLCPYPTWIERIDPGASGPRGFRVHLSEHVAPRTGVRLDAEVTESARDLYGGDCGLSADVFADRLEATLPGECSAALDDFVALTIPASVGLASQFVGRWDCRVGPTRVNLCDQHMEGWRWDCADNPQWNEHCGLWHVPLDVPAEAAFGDEAEQSKAMGVQPRRP